MEEMLSDDALVTKFKAGEEEAFTMLVSRHKEKAVQIIWMTVGNYEDAKDISQDAFVKVYRNLKNFQMKSKFSTWLYRILMNTAKDHLRKKKWAKFMTWKAPSDMEQFLESVEDQSAGPDQKISNRELGVKIQASIASLPQKQRWIFTLRFIEGLALDEIAQVTGASIGTVKASIHFAIKKFKGSIEPFLKGGNIL
ncbi:MAG: sigma-70 family RNA polymerase sigma factor [Candidatus Omnitrophica bacterium]|nr:sigma-70 family RNA polymerase sigma factor [Candidatus Omnitrophota bacterium]